MGVGFLLNLLACGCFYSFVNPQSLNSEQCLSVVKVASASIEPACQPLGDCTGLSCFSNQLNRTVVISVDKCTDPLEVNVTVYDAFGGQVLYKKVTSTGEISDGSYKVNVSRLDRDNFVATIMVVSIVDEVKYTAVPSVELPLNASDCMCEAIKHIGENVEAPVHTECMANSNCTGQECTFHIGDTKFTLEAYAEPCPNPPGIVMIIRDGNGNLLTEDYFDKNMNVSFLGFALLAVTVEHREYSAIIHGRLFFDGNIYNLIPKTHIILDRTSCIVPIKPTATSQTPLPSQTMIVHNPQTCQALKDMRDQTNEGDLSVCTVNRHCDTLECLMLNEYTISFQPKPCRNQPGVHVKASDGGQKVYDNDIIETTRIPVGGSFFVIVNLTQEANGLAMKVDGNLGFADFPIIQKVVIPIETCYSSSMMTRSNTAASSNTLTNTSPSRTPNFRGSSVSTAAVVAIPVTLVLLLLGAATAIVTVVFFIIVYRKRTRIKDDYEATKKIQSTSYNIMEDQPGDL